MIELLVHFIIMVEYYVLERGTVIGELVNAVRLVYVEILVLP
jgi:hypothetical protein